MTEPVAGGYITVMEDSIDMTYDPINSAASRLDEIREELARLQAEAREIEAALTVMRRFAAVPGRAIIGSTDTQSATERGLPISRMGQAKFTTLAKKAIEETGKPMTRTQLLRWFEKNGTPVPGVDANRNAGTKLWRARHVLVNIRGAGYWLRDRDWPAAGWIAKIRDEEAFARAEEDAEMSEIDENDEEAA
jgi:hypothetical protein